MATTDSGLPYPIGTDKVRDGDNAIEALARAVEARIWATNTSVKSRHFSGMWATGSDGRVWIPVPGLATAQGGVASIIGAQRWIARPYQGSGGSLLWEVHDMSGNIIPNIAMTFNIVAWGT